MRGSARWLSTPQRVEGGGTERLELTLIKCRDCGETLGEKDFQLTEEEIQAKAEAKSRRLAKKRKETKRFNERFDKTVAFVVLIVSGLVIYILIIKIWG